jgi:hypothetical protein
LFNQIQAELVESERTVNTAGNVGGKLGGVVGPLTAEVEAGRSASSTSSYQRLGFSDERKCIELMNFMVDNRDPKYFPDRDEWMSRRDSISYWVQWEGTMISKGDVSKLRPVLSPKQKLSPEQRAEAEKATKQYEAELSTELRAVKGFVFIKGLFNASPNGDSVTLIDNFSVQNPTASFRANFPKSAMPDIVKERKVKLTIFGDVLKPLGDDGYVDIRPITVY